MASRIAFNALKPNIASTLRRNAPQTIQSLKQRTYTTLNHSATETTKSSLGYVSVGFGAGILAGGLGTWLIAESKIKPAVWVPTKQDYQNVYNEIARRLDEKDTYDDGSYGPVLVRLAWHCSGTYDKETGTGGSNGATMRFDPEGDHGANSGLVNARTFMERVKEKFPWISYSDLWILGGVCAIQEMGGPSIPWRPGRRDRDLSYCTPDGRLPDGAKGQDHLRAIFYRMGFNDQEIVALSGAHSLGRCHTDRSGFDGPWSHSPITFSNDYFQLLTDEKWDVRKWNGPKQFQDGSTKSLMMLPTDVSLVKDPEFKKHVERYAKDEQLFFKDFSNVFCKLSELGVPFKSDAQDRWTFESPKQ